MIRKPKQGIRVRLLNSPYRGTVGTVKSVNGEYVYIDHIINGLHAGIECYRQELEEITEEEFMLELL